MVIFFSWAGSILYGLVGFGCVVFFFFVAVDRQQRPIYVVWVGLATVGDWVGSNLCGLVGFGCGLR